MSYLYERQCQCCVNRGVASTDRRTLGLQMHNAQHQLNPMQVGVCSQLSLFICCRSGDNRSRILEPLTSRILTQRFVWTGNWCLVSFVFVVVVRQVPWWWWWWWWFVVFVSVAQSCIYVRTDWTTYWSITKGAQVQYYDMKQKRRAKPGRKEKRRCNAAS